MNTPRTDANESLTCKEGDPCIAPDFARQLETELIAMTALADRLAVAIRERDDWAQTMTPAEVETEKELAEALTAYDNSKKIIS